MANQKKLSVGQKLWLVRNERNSIGKPIEVTISKVGKKYFELVELSDVKFEIETLKESTYYPRFGNTCYLSLQAILDEKEFDSLLSEIKKVFGDYETPKLTLEQLRQIKKIINNQ